MLKSKYRYNNIGGSNMEDNNIQDKIDDEILNEKVEPIKQKMKNGEISFDEYTNQ